MSRYSFFLQLYTDKAHSDAEMVFLMGKIEERFAEIKDKLCQGEPLANDLTRFRYNIDDHLPPYFTEYVDGGPLTHKGRARAIAYDVYRLGDVARLNEMNASTYFFGNTKHTGVFRHIKQATDNFNAITNWQNITDFADPDIIDRQLERAINAVVEGARIFWYAHMHIASKSKDPLPINVDDFLRIVDDKQLPSVIAKGLEVAPAMINRMIGETSSAKLGNIAPKATYREWIETLKSQTAEGLARRSLMQSRPTRYSYEWQATAPSLRVA